MVEPSDMVAKDLFAPLPTSYLTKDCEISVSTKADSTKDNPDTQRRIEIRSNEVDLLEIGVNWPGVRRMLHRCNRDHLACSGNGNMAFPQDDRVIDGLKRHIVPLIEGRPYVALSYVCGTTTSTGALNANFDSSLSSYLPEILPRTIEDALAAVSNLGYRCLWVDQLCIDQHCLEEKATQIGQMANIYIHASLTICALGSDVDTGLSGVSHPRDAIYFDAYGLTYVCVPDPRTIPKELVHSIWPTRGWTFQEALLSRRCMYFTADQVLVVCHETTQVEAIQNTQSLELSRCLSDIYGTILKQTATPLSRPSFERLVNHYQDRFLSYKSDALNAFRGLLSMAPTQSYFGVPFSICYGDEADSNLAFLQGLLWRTDHWPEQILRLAAAETQDAFPSWSWIRTLRRHIRCDVVQELPWSFRVHGEPFQYHEFLLSARLSHPHWTAKISVNMLDGSIIPMGEFCSQNFEKVFPEQLPILRLQSFMTTYRIVASERVEPGGRHERKAIIEMRFLTAFDSALEFEPAAGLRSCTNDKSHSRDTVYMPDDISAAASRAGLERLACLLLVKRNRAFWLALKPAYERHGTQYYYREGILIADFKPSSMRYNEAEPPNEIWLA